MTFIHGKNTYISVDGNDLSAFTDSSELGRTADVHDVTTYGKDDHVYEGGLGDSTFKMSGTYDNGVAGPSVLEDLVKSKVVLVRRKEGTGTGKPQETVDVVVKGYTESNPVADMVKWSAEFQGSDAIVKSTQS